MPVQTSQTDDYLEIDLLQLAKTLWKNILVILLVTVICAAAGFAYTKYMVTPLYQSSILIYINNSSISIGSTSVSLSSGDITAAKSLVNTYTVILKTRTTLEEVIRESGLDYTYEQLRSMVTAGSEQNTEVLRVTVTCADPSDAMTLVNTIAKVLPNKISGIIDGTSGKIADYGVIPKKRYSPSYTKAAAVGGLIGMVLSCGVVIVLMLLDTVVHDEDTLKNSYPDIPILAAIPDLRDSGSTSYGNGSKTSSGNTEKKSNKKRSKGDK